MERREFVAVAMGALVAGRSGGQAVRRSATKRAPSAQLGAEVFSRRIERLRAELTTRKLDLFDLPF